MKHAHVNGVDIAYEVEGASDGPWIVLSSSILTTHRLWDPQMELLSRRFRVVRFDTRGHGQSSAPTPPYSMEILVRDVVGLMDYLGVEKASFAGVSLGAMVGMGLAISHPDRIENLIVANARADAPDGFRAGWDDRIAHVANSGIEALVAPTLDRWLSGAGVDQPAVRDALASMIRQTSVKGFEGCARALQDLNYLPGLSDIAVPTLLLAGERDTAVPVGLMEEMRTAISGARLEVVPQAGHISNYEAPEHFNRLIGDFLRIEP